MNFLERMLVKKEMIDVINWIKVHWPHVAAAGLAVLGFLVPAITAWIAAHPGSSLGTFLGLVVAAYNMTAPKDVNRLR